MRTSWWFFSEMIFTRTCLTAVLALLTTRSALTKSDKFSVTLAKSAPSTRLTLKLKAMACRTCRLAPLICHLTGTERAQREAGRAFFGQRVYYPVWDVHCSHFQVCHIPCVSVYLSVLSATLPLPINFWFYWNHFRSCLTLFGKASFSTMTACHSAARTGKSLAAGWQNESSRSAQN